MIRPFKGKQPRIGEHCYIDESVVIIGDVEIADHCSIWPMTVIRGDTNEIKIGRKTNIQDGSVLHVTHAGKFSPQGAPLIIGDEVTVGHKALLHGCRIGNRCLIGMGSIIADNAIVEDHVIIGSGALVPPGKRLQSGYLYIGSPARQAREISDEERDMIAYLADHYEGHIDDYLAQY